MMNKFNHRELFDLAMKLEPVELETFLVKEVIHNYLFEVCDSSYEIDYLVDEGLITKEVETSKFILNNVSIEYDTTIHRYIIALDLNIQVEYEDSTTELFKSIDRIEDWAAKTKEELLYKLASKQIRHYIFSEDRTFLEKFLHI